MACHPDDPAWPIFGLPRIAHSQADFDQIVALHDSPSNAICLCTGSLGSNPDNDIPAIIRHIGERGRIGCLHVRNVKHLGYHHFREAAHLSSSGDLDMFAIMKAIYDTCPDTYIRPDHGRMIWNESGRPGYGLYDRALGATYLNGLWRRLTGCPQSKGGANMKLSYAGIQTGALGGGRSPAAILDWKAMRAETEEHPTWSTLAPATFFAVHCPAAATSAGAGAGQGRNHCRRYL
jgi:hypothetical protein